MVDDVSVPVGEGGNDNAASPDAAAIISGGTYPPYIVEGKVDSVTGQVYYRDLIHQGPWIALSSAGIPNGGSAEPGVSLLASIGSLFGGPPVAPDTKTQPKPTAANDPYAGLRAIYGAENVYPPLETPAGNAQVGGAEAADESNTDAERAPYDSRLIFVKGENAALIYSFTALDQIQVPLVEGMIFGDESGAKGENGDPIESIVASKETRDPNSKKKDAINKLESFYGVPSIMNDNMYTSLPASSGKAGNQYLRDLENKPRWYDMTSNTGRTKANGQPGSSVMQLNIKDLVDWSENPVNAAFPYRFQDFVFLKYWKKVPLNYMITLRRYTRPVIDNVTSQFDKKKREGNSKTTSGDHKSQLGDAARAITFLGEEAGNKISTILGPITAGLKWKDLKADVWNIQGGSGGGSSGGDTSASTPLPGIAKLFAFISGGVKGSDSKGGSGGGGGAPQDPYNNGPYANKIIGPLTVITSTKARERGIEFKHTLKLVFEYCARSIGGINSKAAMLDILGNMMILTFNEAAFWGGYNRHMPGGGGGGGGGSECFVDGTLIDMADGTQKQIEQVETGDIVLTYNTTDGVVEPQKVLELKKFQKSNIIKINLSNGRSVSSTDEHPYYVLGKGWSAYNVGSCKVYNLLFVEQLSVGDILLGVDGEEIEVLSIDYVETSEVNVYTFEVFGNHNYFANGVLVHNKGEPFLGGKAGKEAWMRGDPEAFFGAVVDQFNSVLDTVGDFFKELAGDPVATLMGAGTAAAKGFMKLNTAGGGGSGGGGSSAQALHALLTGDPVGEWHVTVGSPMNPMMMIGNLICTGITINFNDELGPDDFPTEAKFEITLDHGMPRDRAAIEGMFNKGNGRIYSFPPGVKEDEVFASYNMSAVDRATGGKGPASKQQADGSNTSSQSRAVGAGGKAGTTQNKRKGNYDSSHGGKLSHLIDDPGMWARSFGYAKQTLGPTLRNAKNGFLLGGWAHVKDEKK